MAAPKSTAHCEFNINSARVRWLERRWNQLLRHAERTGELPGAILFRVRREVS